LARRFINLGHNSGGFHFDRLVLSVPAEQPLGELRRCRDDVALFRFS
jgi:hypothetical protein